MPAKPHHHENAIAQRLAEILRRLNDGQKLDPRALAEEFEVDLRTIQRDLNQRLNLPRTDGRYALPAESVGKFGVQEVSHLAGLAGLQGPKLSARLIKEIVTAGEDSALRVRGVGHEEGLAGKEEDFDRLKAAIEQHRTVSFRYHKPSGSKQVLVQPYKLVNHSGIWYLAAADEGQLKSYAFGRIEGVFPEEGTFTPDPLIQKTLAEEDSVWLNLNKTEVVLKVAKPAASYFQRRKLIGGQKIVKELEDGGLIVSGLIAHPDQILPTVRYWIPNVRIISPEKLQADMENQLQEYLGHS